MAALNRHILMPELVGDQFPLKCFSISVDLSLLFFGIMNLVLSNEEVTVDLGKSLFFFV